MIASSPTLFFPLVFWSLIRAAVDLSKFNRIEGLWRRKEGQIHHHFQCFSYIKRQWKKYTIFNLK